MAEQEVSEEQLSQIVQENEVDENKPNYKPPAVKSLQEIQQMDAEDESLVKYKEALLGKSCVKDVDPNTPNVQVTRMTLLCDSAPSPLILDLTGDLEKFKKNPFVLREAVEYKIKINFKVNKEIVSGLRYSQQSFRKGIRVDKSDYMVGSYGPRPNEEYEFLTPLEESPSGFMTRGTYIIKSKFTDDDKHDHLSWEWNLNIKKEWID